MFKEYELTGGSLLKAFPPQIADINALYFLFQSQDSGAIIFFSEIWHNEIYSLETFCKSFLWVLTA